MFAMELRAAVEAAPRERLCDLSKALWQAFGAGGVSEAEAEELSALIEARRAVGKSRQNGDSSLATRRFVKMTNLSPRKPQRPPVRSVAIERRRRLAASGPMPPALAARFTVSELAVLRIVADEVRERGLCALCLDAIAARAGAGRTTAQNAIRQAKRLGMVEVVERRRPGAKSLPNLVTVVDREWQTWIRHHGFKKPNTTDKEAFRVGASEPKRIAPFPQTRIFATGKPVRNRDQPGNSPWIGGFGSRKPNVVGL